MASDNKHMIGLSEEEVRAAEALDVLRHSHNTGSISSIIKNAAVTEAESTEDEKHEDEEPEEDDEEEEEQEEETLLDRVYKNVATFYDDFSSRKRVASIARLLDDAYEENYTDAENEDEEQEKGGYNDEDGDNDGVDNEWDEYVVSKRRKLSEALLKSKDNFKEYKLA